MSDEQDRARVTYPADLVLPMTETRAREILGDWIRPDGSIRCGDPYVNAGVGGATLDGGFSVETLEALTWWMRNKADE